MNKFYMVFSNDDVEFFTQIGRMWTEHGEEMLHIQFDVARDGTGSDNFWPSINSDGHYLIQTADEQIHACRQISFEAVKPTTGREVPPSLFENFWVSPNR